MKDNKLMLLLLMFVTLFVTASCSESDEEDVEFPNWIEYNDKSFQEIYAHAKEKVSSGDSSWKIIRNWSYSDEYDAKYDDNIVVKVLSEGKINNETPMYTDSVFIAYSGRLLPSTSFANGYVFDSTYKGEFNPATASSLGTGITMFVNGFTTALMQMHRGDFWRVYIPAKLAYGKSVHSTIPVGSVLTFDLYLFDFIHPSIHGQDGRK